MSEYNIKSLAPFSKDNKSELRELEGYSVYEGFLNKALNDKDINKIAITGNFGIGKSSFIRCFERKNNYQFFYVSLEDFRKNPHQSMSTYKDNNTDKDDSSEENDTVETVSLSVSEKGSSDNNNGSSTSTDKSNIEYSLLKNIIYQCDKKCLKASGIELVQESNTRLPVIITSIYALVLTMAIMTISFPEQFSEFIHGFWGGIFSQNSFHQLHMTIYVVVTILVAIGVGTIVYFILTHVKLSKINIKTGSSFGEGEAEMVGKTILDEYGREFVFIFEQLAKKYAAFVFEDFDRINADVIVDILCFLYDINTIVNSRLKRKGKHVLKFCFAINDMVISNIQATKYFDYIMPIIPELNSNMSCEYFSVLLYNEGVVIQREDPIWKTIHLLTDYRTINQIINEFSVILLLEKKKRREANNELVKSILAFSIYKVIFPEDYYNIRLGKSLVFPEYLVSSENTNPNVFEILKGLEASLDYKCFDYIGFSEQKLIEWKTKQLLGKMVDDVESNKKQIIVDELNQLKNSHRIVSNNTGLCVKTLFNDSSKQNMLLKHVKIVYFLDAVCYLLSMEASCEKEQYVKSFKEIFKDLKEEDCVELNEVQIKDFTDHCKGVLCTDFCTTDNIQIVELMITILHNNGMKDFNWLLSAGIDIKSLIRVFEKLCNNEDNQQLAISILNDSQNHTLYESISNKGNYIKEKSLARIINC